jgi:hypothetical protein
MAPLIYNLDGELWSALGPGRFIPGGKTPLLVTVQLDCWRTAELFGGRFGTVGVGFLYLLTPWSTVLLEKLTSLCS